MNVIEEQVLRTIGENIDSPDVFTDTSVGMALIRTSINDAIQEICMLLGAYTRDYHLPLLADRQWYRLTPEHDHIAYITEAYDHNRKKTLDQTDVISLATNTWFLKDKGYPEEYVFVGHNVFGVSPFPGSEGHLLILKCVCIPKPYLNDYDVIYLRDYLQRAAAFYAISEYFASRGDAKRAQEQHAKYLEIAQLTNLKQTPFDRTWTSYTKDDHIQR